MGELFDTKIKGNIINLLFPRRCPICHEIVVPGGIKICGDCRRNITYINEPKCKKCSKEVSSYETEYCYDCSVKKHYYDEGVALFKHDKIIKKSIYQFKYRNKREYADFYSEEIFNKFNKKIYSWNADVIIPIPLYRNKKISRGFNQSEVLAKKLSKYVNLNVDSNVLFRTKQTNAQKELNKIERVKNLENAFKIRDKIVQYNKVILIDDIYTTGATIDSCAKALKEAGVKRVYFITISIGDGF